MRVLLDHCIKQNGNRLTGEILNTAILRSFGGLERAEMEFLVAQTFWEKCGDRLRELVDGECGDPAAVLLSKAPPMDLVLKNLKDVKTLNNPGGRHLMVLSDNNAGLDILLEPYNGVAEVTAENTKIIMGSAFPDDGTRNSVYRNINQIKECMKTGTRIVLLDLDELYESLYDMLNQ